jgi:hypothetical protein
MVSIPNFLVDLKKSLELKVTTKSALPCTAVSSTNSSSGSVNWGLRRYGKWTKSPILQNALTRATASSAAKPETAKCSGLVSTDSYSSANGTETKGLNSPATTASTRTPDAPVGLRIAATRTEVSKTTRKKKSYHRQYHPTDHAGRAGFEIAVASQFIWLDFDLR